MLLLVGVPDRSQPGPVPDEPGSVRDRRGARRRARLRAGRDPRAGGRSRAGQRRPGAARRVLHGLAGDAGAARGRLRHPLRLRDVRAGHRGRAPDRAARQLAAARQPLGAAPARGRAEGALLRPRRAAPRRHRAHDRRLGRHAHGDRPAPRLVHRRPPHRHGEHAAPVGGARDARLRPAVLQRGRLPARGRGEDRHGEHLQGPLPQRPERGRQGAAPQAAVLLRRLLDRRHRAALQAAARHLRRVPRQGRDPAQRHAPGDRGGRADAGLPRRREARLGPRLEPVRADLRLHQPHADARGAGTLAGEAVREDAAAPPHADLRDQPPLHAPGADALAGRHGSHAAHVDLRGGRRQEQAGPHGAPGDRRLAQHQRRGGAAHRAHQEPPDARLPSAVARAVQQQDQRGHAAALGAVREPAAHAPHHVTHRIGVDRPRPLAGEAAARARRRPAIAERPVAGQAAEQARPGGAGATAHRRRAAARRDGGHPDQALSRVQAAAARLPADRRALHGAQARIRAPTPRRARTSSPARPRPATRWPSCTSS